jgi:putative amino acid transporter
MWMIFLNPVVLSVVAMVILCLLGFNVILALIAAALIAGVLAGMPIVDTMSTLIAGMGGNAETALSYILLGALAAAIHESGLAAVLSREIAKVIKGRSIPFILLIAFITIFSQNLLLSKVKCNCLIKYNFYDE